NGLEEIRCDRLRKCDDAVVIADDDVAGFDDQAADRHLGVDFSGAVLEWPAMDGGTREAREARLRERIAIADRAVDDEAGRAADLRDRHHDLADKGAADIAVAVDND